MNMCGSFQLLSAAHSLFRILTNLKRSEKIPEAPARRWGVWIWLTGPAELHRTLPQGLNISSIRVFDQIRDLEIPISLRPYIYIGYIYDHHQRVLPKGRSFTAKSGTKAAVLPKDRSSTVNSGTTIAVLLAMNRCGSFPLISDLKRTQGHHRGGNESGFG